MVKHTQTIRRQIADELFECVWPFCGVALKGLSELIEFYSPWNHQRTIWWAGTALFNINAIFSLKLHTSFMTDTEVEFIFYYYSFIYFLVTCLWLEG